MEELENIKKAIAILDDAKEKAHDLLEINPTLQLRMSNTLEKLTNGLRLITGEAMQEGGKPFEFKKLTSVFGREIVEKKELKVKHTSWEDVDLLRETAELLIDTFPEQQSKELAERLTDMEIRAVAKLAGLEVTSTQPAKITVPFIDKIKEAIVKSRELKEAQEAELAKTKEPLEPTEPSKTKLQN